MNDSLKQECRPVELDAKATCDQCGTFGAYVFDGGQLCADCYGSRGSCCNEGPDYRDPRKNPNGGMIDPGIATS